MPAPDFLRPQRFNIGDELFSLPKADSTCYIYVMDNRQAAANSPMPTSGAGRRARPSTPQKQFLTERSYRW
jgi:hypothetical protein